MIQHIVLLKWKPGTTDEQVLEAFAHARNIPNLVEGVERLTIGRNRGHGEDHGFTHALSVQVDDYEALSRYLAHPAREEFVTGYLKPLEEQRIEVDIPVDMSIAADPHRNWQWGATAGMGPPLDDD